MSHYKIKLNDKAAFLNRLEKQDVRVDSYDITDNKLKGYFEIDVDDEQANTIIKSILKSSPKINTVKEMKQKITKSQLAEIIREEMDKMKAKPAVKPEMEEAANEIMQWISANSQVLSTLAGLIGITTSAVGAGIASQFKAAKAENPGASFKTLVSKAAGKVLGAADAATGANTPGQGIGGNR
jgi:Pyruvate/2-oxoacid:ferredoxin oxidoreductase gamma subunit